VNAGWEKRSNLKQVMRLAFDSVTDFATEESCPSVDHVRSIPDVTLSTMPLQPGVQNVQRLAHKLLDMSP
jgi:hypothetical protein